MAAKKNVDVKFLKGRLTKVNKVLGKLEGEVEKALNTFMKKSEKSSRIIRKNVDEIFDKIATSDIYSKANEKGEELIKEAKKIADDIVDRLKKIDLRFAKPMIKEARANLDEIVDRIQKAGVVDIAKEAAINTRNGVLKVLNLPTHSEVVSLNQKVARLEKKLKALNITKAA